MSKLDNIIGYGMSGAQMGGQYGGGWGAAESIFDTEQFGINPDTNIRSDRFVIAVETMDKVNRSRVAKRLNDKKDGRTVEDNATDSIVTE